MSNFGNIEDSFKDVFSNWEPEHSAADMNKAWQNVSKHIPAPHAGHTAAQQAGKSLIKGGVSAGKIAAISSIAAVVVTSAILLYNANTSSSQKDKTTQKQVVKENIITQSPENKSVTDQNTNTGNTTQAENNSSTTNNRAQTSRPSNIIASGVNSSTHPEVSKSNAQTGLGIGSSGPVSQGQKSSPQDKDAIAQTSSERNLEDTSICESDDYILKNVSSIKMIIDWGDGSNPAMSFNTAKHYYSKPGNYMLSIQSDGEIINRQVRVKRSPSVHFSYFASEGTTAKFKNTSEGASNFKWEFGDNTTDETPSDPEHAYGDTGNYKVKLTASYSGCTNTITRDIHVSDHTFLIPNIFTPNGDGKDDYFEVSMKGLVYYELTIIERRTGKAIFHSTDINNKWAGDYGNGVPCPVGDYSYIILYQYPNEAMGSHEGEVRLNR